MAKKTLNITLPIYYIQEYKTKDDKNLLIGLNNYRNWHHVVSNKIKHWYQELVIPLVAGFTVNQFSVHYKIYAARNGTDGPNIRSVVEKFFLDGFIEAGGAPDDCITYLVSDSSEYFIDKENPRVEILVTEI